MYVLLWLKIIIVVRIDNEEWLLFLVFLYIYIYVSIVCYLNIVMIF